MIAEKRKLFFSPARGTHIVHGMVCIPRTACTRKLDEPLSVKSSLQCILNGHKEVSRQSAIELIMPPLLPSQ